MKRLFNVFSILVLIAITVLMTTGAVMAQEVPPPEDSGATNLFFCGLRIVDGEFIGSYGIGTPVGSNFYILQTINVGDPYGQYSTDVAYFFSPIDKLSLGILAGPNVSWLDNAEGNTPLTYLTGAAGGIMAYDVNEKMGLFGHGYYAFRLEESAFPENWDVGGGLYIRF